MHATPTAPHPEGGLSNADLEPAFGQLPHAHGPLTVRKRQENSAAPASLPSAGHYLTPRPHWSQADPTGPSDTE